MRFPAPGPRPSFTGWELSNPASLVPSGACSVSEYLIPWGRSGDILTCRRAGSQSSRGLLSPDQPTWTILGDGSVATGIFTDQGSYPDVPAVHSRE